MAIRYPKPNPLPPVRRLAPNVAEASLSFADSKADFWFLLRSDVHHDHPHSDRKMERRHLDEAMDRGAMVLDNGDLFCAMQGKFDKRGSKDNVRPEHQRGDYLDSLVRTAAEFYRPFAGLFGVLGTGNHETSIRKRHETDLTDRLAERLRADGSPVVTTGYGGWVLLRCQMPGGHSDTIRLHHYHGTGGGGPVTRGVIQTNRMAVYTPDAQIVLTGHTHDEWTVPIARQRISKTGAIYHDEQLHVRVPGYKDAWGDGGSGWEVETGKGPKPKGAAWLRVWWERSAGFRYEVTRAK